MALYKVSFGLARKVAVSTTQDRNQENLQLGDIVPEYRRLRLDRNLERLLSWCSWSGLVLARSGS